MATLITPSVIAASALATLYNTTVLLPLVNRDYDSDFQGKQGDTITVRTPASFTVDEFDRNQGIQLQDPTEGSFTVTLDKLLDVSFPITAEELTLELDRFEERLLNPAMEAISQDVDGRIAEQLVDAANSVGGGGVADGTGTNAGERHAAFRESRRILGRNKLPLPSRYAVLSPESVEAITGDEIVLQANTSGSTQALREGSVGRLSAFDTFESQVFGADDGVGDRATADGVAFHRSAVAAVSRTLERPMGVAPNQVAVEGYKGLGLRVVKDYDIDLKQDVISIDLLFGAQTIRKQAAIELDFGQGS
jgi:hypothetical protein